jgi:hypothetical protein
VTNRVQPPKSRRVNPSFQRFSHDQDPFGHWARRELVGEPPKRRLPAG